jgi:hypothetical protein
MDVTRRAFAEVPENRYRALTGDAFFVSRGFAELWRTRDGEPCVWCAEADGALIAVLPGVEFRRGPLRRFAAMPDGCYGGVFVAAEAAAENDRCARMLLAALTRRYAVVDIFDFRRGIGVAPGWQRRPCEARLITLTGPGWVPADPTLEQQAQKAAREGIDIEPFDAERHLSGLMRLADETARVHRCRQRYPRAFFAALAALARSDGRIVWRWCEHDGLPAASQLYVIEDGMLMAWQSYFDRRFSFLKPNQAMRLDVCRAFAAGGGRLLNLGATPRRAAGLAAYKRRWGGRLVPYLDHSWNALAGLRTTLMELAPSSAAPGRKSTAVPMRRTGA